METSGSRHLESFRFTVLTLSICMEGMGPAGQRCSRGTPHDKVQVPVVGADGFASPLDLGLTALLAWKGKTDFDLFKSIRSCMIVI